MNSDEEYFIRELTRKLDEQINSVRRELDNLKKIGFLKAKTKNRKKYYCINKDFAILNELKSIFMKTLNTKKLIADEIRKFGKPKLLILSGQFVEKPTETVDMLIVGELNKEKLANYLNNELRTQRPVKFTILSEEDYEYRLECKDQFISEIINNSENETLIED